MTDKDKSAALVGLSDELHKRLEVQANNLLFEYKYSPNDDTRGLKRGYVPVEAVKKLMLMYGNLIAKEIFKDQKRARNKAKDPVDMLRLAGIDVPEEDATAIRGYLNEIVEGDKP